MFVERARCLLYVCVSSLSLFSSSSSYNSFGKLSLSALTFSHFGTK